MSDNIKVAIKVRPLIKREKDEKLAIQWVTQGNAIVAVDTEIKRRGDGAFQFDHIFDMDANNKDVFHNTVMPIVDAAVNGFNGTVFAYGQTSSGKTYTMMGTREDPGIIPLAIEHMFDAIADTPRREFLLRVSYLEIYNEKVNDLLNKEGTDLKVHEDQNGQVFVNCKEEVTNSLENVLSIMSKGNKRRRIGETNMNERSSRSHTIFRITIESREADSNSDGAVQVSQLNMVDLAGSERARQTGAVGERFKEGRHINLSLSTLALVMKQLSEAQDSQKFINFRDSKLTRLLQISLSGNAMTTIICAVTPVALEETQCSLSFASRAKIIKNKPQLNEVMSDGALLKRYAKQIAKLQAELQKMKDVNQSAQVEEMEYKIQEGERINECLQKRIKLLQTRIVTGDNRNTESFQFKATRRRTWCGTGGYKPNSSSYFPCKNLSPIKEIPFPSCNDNDDIMGSSFQVAYTDFELELLTKDHEEENDSDDDTFVTYRKTSKSPSYNDFNSISEKADMFTQTASNQSPGTPKEDLRKRIRHLTEEYTQLREYTTLEKQLYIEDRTDEIEEKLAKFSKLEKQLENVTSDKDAFQYIASDLRIKLNEAELRYTSAEDKLSMQLAELQRIPNLEKKLAQLSAQEMEVQNIPELQKQITDLIAEKEGYKHFVSELKKKLIKAEQCNILLEDKLSKQNVETEEPLIRFSLDNESTQQIEFKANITALASEKDELQHQISHLQDKLTAAEQCNNSTRDELDKQKLTYVQNIKDLEEKVINLTSEKNAFDRTVCDMRNRLRESEEVNNTLRGKLKEQRLEMERLQDQEKRIEQITSQKNELEAIIGELQEKLVEAEVTNTSMKGEINEHQRNAYKFLQLEKQIQDIVTEKMEFERINNELKDKLKEAELLNNSMKSKLSDQQLCIQRVHDLEKQLEDFVTEKNELQNIIAELKEKLEQTELTNNSLQNKSNEMHLGETDDLQIPKISISKNSEFERTNPELHVKLEKIVSHDNSFKEELNVQQEETQNFIEEEEKYKISSLEKSKLENTISELQEKLKEAELHNILIEDKMNNQELKLQMTHDLEKEIEQLTLNANKFEFMIKELQEKLAKAENDISVQNKPDELRLQRIEELEAQIARLTSEKDEYERISMDVHKQLVKSSAIEKSTSDCDNDNEIDRMKCHINDMQSIIYDIQNENMHLKEQVSSKSVILDNEHNLSNGDSSKFIEDLSSTRISYEEDNAKLSADLVFKTQDELKRDVQSLKEDAENLQKTIYLLTTENTELANKLLMQKECAEESTMHLQKTIDELYERNSKITDEKLELENNLVMLNEQIEILRSKIPESNLNEEQVILEYEEQINTLTDKNTELLSNIADRMKEIEMLKESKSLLYEHDCMYKDKLTDFMEKYEHLTTENNNLSTDLMKKLEENDEVRQECNILKSKLELTLKNKEDISNNDEEKLRTENTLLKTELVELKANIKDLNEENSQMSTQLIETIEDLDNARKINSCNNSLHLSTLFNNSLRMSDTMDKSVVNGDLEAKVLNLQGEVNHLKCLNRKLSDLKLSTCTQCTHLKEVNENRRMLKLEVKSLTHKLADSQKKFDNEYAKTDMLIMKAKEDINTSLLNSSFNVSFSDSMNVTYVEETLHSVNNELQSLKKDNEGLSDSCKEQCDETQELQNSIVTNSLSTEEVSSNIKRSSSKTSARLDNIVKVMSNLQNEFQELKQNNLSVRTDLNKFTNEKEALLNEIDSLKIANEDLLQKLSENEFSLIATLEKANILENEVTDMTEKLQELTVKCKEIENAKLLLEVEAESLKEDKVMKEQTVGELRQCLSCLQNELDLMKKHKEELNDVSRSLEKDYQEKIDLLKVANEELINSKVTISQQLADYTKESESRMLELDEKINKCTSENDYLKQEMIKLRNIEDKYEKMKNEYETKSEQDKTLAEDNKKFKILFDTTSKNIIKEIMSLKPKTNSQELEGKSIDELFQIFLQTILAKEKEIARTMQALFEKEKQKLEDEKQQSVDAEKRTTLWAKELEREIEKLQGDLIERENISSELRKEIARLQQLLKENNNDRETLREKNSNLEMDLGNMQVELEKYSKTDIVNEEAVINAQKREKQAQDMIKNKEAEFQLKLKSEKEDYNKRIEDLVCTIETFKTKNIELMGNIEGLEANEKQLKNIIELKTNELMKNNQIIQKMRIESEQLTEAYNDLNNELETRNLRIAEITDLLKTKCDELTEYKTNLETIVPENKFLKQQVGERKANIEQYKIEIESLKMTNEQALDAIKDKLNLEELKSVELNKQMSELNNKNVALTEEMDNLRKDYETLQCKCITLEKRMRNSTSKIQAEEQMEELKDLNRSLRNNLDGASNRITELQAAKTDLTKQLITLNNQYETACKEIEELKKMYKSTYNKVTDEKYDVLLREKNQVALELEATKLELSQKSKAIDNYTSKISELSEKNKELDQELDELAEVIRQQNVENAKLEDKYYSCRVETDSLQDKIKVLERKNQSFVSLKKNVSSESYHDDECSCTTLKNKIRELQLEVVSKNGKIATLELQIRSGSFPYQAKCKELQEHLSAYSNKNSELKAEVNRLQLAMLRTSAKECDICKQRLVNRKNQACQTIPNNVIRFCGTSSGIIEDDIRINKLEKEKKLMKDLCRSRSKTIKELEKRLEEYETSLHSKN